MSVGSVLQRCISTFLLVGLMPQQHVMALQFLGAQHQVQSAPQFMPKLFQNGRARSEVFFPGPDGLIVPYYRIPALLALDQIGETTPPVLLAFAEKRFSYTNDAGQVQVVMRRSLDSGLTWGEEHMVCNMGNTTCGNPTPVEDKHGHIHLLVSSNPFGKGETEQDEYNRQLLSSKVERRAWVIHSEDRGATWTYPNEITSSVKKSTWLWYATGPGHGIRLSNQVDPKHNGRLVVGADHSEVVKDNGKVCYSSHVIYSDDDGETWGVHDPWQFTNNVEKGLQCHRSNEASIAESTDGQLIAYSRQLTHEFTKLNKPLEHTLPAETVHALFGKSVDGGDTWGGQHRNDQLGDLPTCQGALVTHVDSEGRQRILFSHPSKYNEFGGREHLRIDVSEDGGETWPREQRIVVHKGNSGYSDMQVLSDGTLALLHEMSAQGIQMRLYHLSDFSNQDERSK